ncbi:MAG: hypothetical protein ACOYB7_03185 [Mycobacterium sp.]
MTARWLRAGVTVLGLGLMLAFAPQALAEPAEQVPSPAVESSPAAAAGITPPDGVPHLPSPDSLPPGATQSEPEHRNLGYLRDIWQAVRSKDVSMSDALLLIAQRPMDLPAPAGSP